MQSYGEKSRFLTAFTGQDRFVVDYLLEEVFQQQMPEMQTFLLQTAILDELSGPLCDAIIGRVDVESVDVERADAELPEKSQEILEALERANLFLVPLDNERRWYRYQQLFRDFLLGRLAQTQPLAIAELHRMAATWYREQDLLEAAIEHALAGADFEMAVELLQSGNAHDLGAGPRVNRPPLVERAPQRDYEWATTAHA